jgi:hypothetical protein
LNTLDVPTALLTPFFFLLLSLQAVSTAMYMYIYTPRHVCPLVLSHASHVAYVQQLWRLLDSIAHHTAQVIEILIFHTCHRKLGCWSNTEFGVCFLLLNCPATQAAAGQ